MMTELEWRAAEWRNPDKTYVEPKSEWHWCTAAAWACFAVMPMGAITPAALIWGAPPALAVDSGGSNHQNPSDPGTYESRHGGCPACGIPPNSEPVPRKTESTGGQRGDPFGPAPNIGEEGDGMTSRDAYYFRPSIHQVQEPFVYYRPRFDALYPDTVRKIIIIPQN